MDKERFVHYKTGYQEIDDEHFSLLNHSGNVIRMCHNKDTDTELIKLGLESLNTDLLAHMLHEEQLMRDGNYKYVDSHIQSHNDIRFRMRKIMEPGSFNPHHLNYVVSELEHIFINHIDSYDMQIRLKEPPTRPVPL